MCAPAWRVAREKRASAKPVELCVFPKKAGLRFETNVPARGPFVTPGDVCGSSIHDFLPSKHDERDAEQDSKLNSDDDGAGSRRHIELIEPNKNRVRATRHQPRLNVLQM